MGWLNQRLAILIPEEQYVAFAFNECALREGPPQGVQSGLL
jgi:hypothetical protein